VSFTPGPALVRGDEPTYQGRKQKRWQRSSGAGPNSFGWRPEHYRHSELAHAAGFAHWTGMALGFVGGLGQRPSRVSALRPGQPHPAAGLLALRRRIHGEGTAGVSLSAADWSAGNLLGRAGPSTWRLA